MRYRSHPEALEPFLAELRQAGIPETNLSNVRVTLIAWREAYLDREALYRVDLYLTAGIGAADLVLLPVILPLGAPDRPLFIAVLSLAISLVLVGSSLFVSFVKRMIGLSSYGKVHSTLVALSLLSGASAMSATFWHVSSFVGVTFLVLTVLAYLMCAAYFAFARIGVGILRSLQAASTANAPNTSEPSEPEKSEAPA